MNSAHNPDVFLQSNHAEHDKPWKTLKTESAFHGLSRLMVLSVLPQFDIPLVHEIIAEDPFAFGAPEVSAGLPVGALVLDDIPVPTVAERTGDPVPPKPLFWSFVCKTAGDLLEFFRSHFMDV